MSPNSLTYISAPAGFSKLLPGGYMQDEKNFFAGLFDFSFNSLLTRRIVKLLYIISILGGGIAVVACVVVGVQHSLAGGLGWMLDAMDVMLYSLVLTYLIREFSMDTRTAGFLNSLTLVASAIGGLLFGMVADRIGRTRSLMVSILVYSLASAACAFSHSVAQLAVFRFVLGLGMGGEWTAAAALIAETWRTEHSG